MPHNIYLHSGLVKGKIADFDRSSDSAISVLNCYSFIDSSIALFISFLVNLSVVGTFAHFFYAPECSNSNLACVPVMENEVSFGEICTNAAIPIGSPAVSILLLFHINSFFFVLTLFVCSFWQTCAEIGLDEAGDALASTIGPLGVIIWAVGLLAAGLASTMSTTFAGQVVMDGFLDLRLAPWQRASVTRLAALGPSLLIAVFTSDNAGLRNNINEWLNILQSIQLPFALIPVISFCASKSIMGEFRQRGIFLVASVMLALLVLFANIYLVTQFLVEHPSGGLAAGVIASIAGVLYFLFVGILTKTGVQMARDQPESRGGGGAGYGSIVATSDQLQGNSRL
jgi:natural resistance-associated macrophage protein